MASALDDCRLSELQSPCKPEDPLLGRVVSKRPCSSKSLALSCFSVRQTCQPHAVADDPEPSFQPEPQTDDVGLVDDSESTGITGTGSWLLSAVTDEDSSEFDRSRGSRASNHSEAFLNEFKKRRAVFHESLQAQRPTPGKETFSSWVQKALGNT